MVVIDFEEWLPLYELNKGTSEAYQIMSQNTEIKDYPELKNDSVKIKVMVRNFSKVMFLYISN